MIEEFIVWLAELPPLAIYGVIALLATVENIFPPFPADTAIAMGAFLAHRGVTDPMLVFVVTIVANVGGAMVIYFLAARHSDSLLESRLARWLIPDNGLALVQKEYDKFGLPGLFVARLLPGFRAVVTPFAGLTHIGPGRTLIPVAFASAIWYGGIIFGAAMLGERFEDILVVLSGVNRTLSIVAAILAVVIIVVLLRRRNTRRSS